MDTQALIEKVKQTVEELREELVWATSRIMMFETVSGAADEAGKKRYREGIADCAAWLESLTLRMGFRWITKPGRWYCIEWPASPAACPASKAAKPIVLGIPAHIDVVPASGQWIHPPFGGVVADRIIWGRGTQDDKGPLIATLYGLYALKKTGFEPPASFRIIIGTQEEISEWSDIYEYLAEEGNPDFGFTPDADFPLIIGEKGMLTLTASYKWTPDFAEPNQAPAPKTPQGAGGEVTPAAQLIEFVSLHGGTRSNIVPDLCEWTLRYPAARREEVIRFLLGRTTQFAVENPLASITLVPDKAKPAAEKTARGEGAEELLVSFLGKSAHGSTPEKGHNAVLDALRFIIEAQCAPASVLAFAQFLVVGCSDLLGGALNVASKHDFVGATTVNLGVAHFDASGGETLINLRPTLGLDVKDAEKPRGPNRRGLQPTLRRIGSHRAPSSRQQRAIS